MSAQRKIAAARIESGQEILFQHFARMGQALANPQRLKMLGLLCHGPRTVEELAAKTGQSLALASAHLKALRAACLVRTEKEGRHVRCRVADPAVARLWLTLRETGAALLPEAKEVVSAYFSGQENLEPVSPRQLAAQLKKGAVTVIDLRSPEEYAAGHLPGAINIPAAAISAQAVEKLPQNGTVYAYCRGPYCVTAPEGVEKLRTLRVPARRLGFSVPEWRQAGLKAEGKDS